MGVNPSTRYLNVPEVVRLLRPHGDGKAHRLAAAVIVSCDLRCQRRTVMQSKFAEVLGLAKNHCSAKCWDWHLKYSLKPDLSDLRNVKKSKWVRSLNWCAAYACFSLAVSCVTQWLLLAC